MEVKSLFILFPILAIFLVSCTQEIWHTVSTYSYPSGWDEITTPPFEIKGKMWKVNYILQHAEYGCATYYAIQKKCVERASDLSKGLSAVLNIFIYTEDGELFKLVESHDFALAQNEVISDSFTIEGKGTYYLVIRHSNALSSITIEDYY